MVTADITLPFVVYFCPSHPQLHFPPQNTTFSQALLLCSPLRFQRKKHQLLHNNNNRSSYNALPQLRSTEFIPFLIKKLTLCDSFSFSLPFSLLHQPFKAQLYHKENHILIIKIWDNKKKKKKNWINWKVGTLWNGHDVHMFDVSWLISTITLSSSSMKTLET